MLVLSRKTGEEIVLPNRGVTIGVVAVKGKQVRLGIAAPSEIPVHRGEVWHRIHKSHQSAHDLRTVDRKTLRVLIADADHDLLLSYQESLGERGFNVDTATSGLECVSHLRRYPPHVLILDPSILWGGGDGVLALMREENDVPAVPVLVHASPHDGAMSTDLVFPVSARVSKPLPPERMASVVRQLANNNRNHPETLPETIVDDDWRHETKRRITARTHGRVFDTEVELIDGRLIVRGRSRSYYGKQLACAAAVELMESLDSAPIMQVELDIEVLGT